MEIKMEGKMRFYYDDEDDYLTIFMGDSRPNYGEDIEEGITLFKDEKTDEIIGLGIINFRQRAKTLQDLEFKLPSTLIFQCFQIQ